MATLPVSPDTIYDELKSCHALLGKWIERIGVKGLPGLDLPGGDDQLDDALKEFCGETLLVSRKLEALSEIVESNSSGPAGG
jgi:hypothetical protein